MTKLLCPPRPISVSRDPRGSPAHLGEGAFGGRIQVLSRWLTQLDWWCQPVEREYWRIIVADSMLCEIFLDLTTQRWWLERIYD